MNNAPAPVPAPAAAPHGPSALRLARWLWAQQARAWWVILPLAGFQVSVDACLTLTYKLLIDNAALSGHGRVLGWLLAALAVWVALAALLSYQRDRLYARAVTRVLDAVREALFRTCQRLSASYWDTHASSDVLARFTTDLAGLESWLSSALNSLVVPGLSVLMSVGLLFVLLPRDLALLGTLIWPVVLFGPRLIAPRAAAANYAKRQHEAALLGTITDLLATHRLARVYSLEALTLERFRQALQPLSASVARTVFLGSLVELTTVVTIYGVQVCSVAAGAILVYRGALTVGSLMAFLNVFWNLGWSIVVLARSAPQMVSAAAALRRIEELLASPADPIEQRGGLPLPPLRDKLQFEHVAFGYPLRPHVLVDVSLEVQRGEFVAIVGTSGCGKSSLVSLLAQFYDPEAGCLRLDGHDLRTADVAAVRAQMGFVLQDTLLFDTTIADNIRLGRAGASDDEVIAAARQAELHDAILALPDGYATRVGEGGSQLSGGQRQRLGIARALIRDPAILLLDEATSALDPATEAALSQTLLRAGEGRTTIAITHRLATIRGADRIFVLQQGRIVEQGRHDELLALNGAYARQWRRQGGFEVSADGSVAAVSPDRLRDIPLLEPLDDAQLTRLATRFASLHVPAGAVVCREGEPGDLFYLLARGEASVSRRGADGQVAELARLGAGDEFGELALLRDVPRNATVTARVDSLLLTLTRQQFLDLLRDVPQVRARIEAVAAARG